MEPMIMYVAGSFAAGVVVGAVANHVRMKDLVKNLNDGVNTLRGDEKAYSPRENAHWLIGELEEEEVIVPVETPAPKVLSPEEIDELKGL